MKDKSNKESIIKKIKNATVLSKVLLGIINVLTIFVIVMTFILDLLPLKFLIPISIILLLIDYVMVLLLIKRNKKKRITGQVITIILSLIYIVGIVYEFKTNNFFDLITKNNNKIIENYQIIVKADSSYNEIGDLDSENIGILDSAEDGYKKAVEKINSVIDAENISYSDSYTATDALFAGEVESFLIEESQEAILEENYENYKDQTKVLYSFTIETIVENTKKDTDVTKNTFNVFISGIDTYGSINYVSRSDVNIVATINPKTGKMSLISIPRDYYVQLYNKGTTKDKLTHAGVYGIDTSVKTVENLLGIDINYYLKFNFTSVIQIVDKLGGVTVYSDMAFDSGKYDRYTREVYHYNQGMNTLNGKQALSFARERKRLPNGDRSRGVHQEALIAAILKKVTSPEILVNYTSLLDALSETFVTNLDGESLKKLVKLQLDKNIDWDISNLVMNGTGSNEYTYSYPRQKLYVMIPSEESLNEAKNLIATIAKG